MEVTEFKVELVRTVDESYPIVVGRGLDAKVVELASRGDLAERRIAVITDTTVVELAGKSIARALADA